MHDTAFQIGGLVMNNYLPEGPAKILEIGSLDVNGSLRAHAPAGAEYVGMDFESGPGVDIVIDGTDYSDVPDKYFDLVMASSVFEHDSAFWKTFLQMCAKAKPGGFVYISAPSNGLVHRFPRDCWRFYPDAGLALEDWARSEGLNVMMIESFIAERIADCWNDFCAVFQVEPGQGAVPHEFVHEKVSATNALDWRTSLPLKAEQNSEDMRIIADVRQKNHDLMQACANHEGLQRELQAENSKIAVDIAAKERVIAEGIEELGRLRAQIENFANDIVRRDQEMLRMQAALASEQGKTNWLSNTLLIVAFGKQESMKNRILSWLPAALNRKLQLLNLKDEGLFDSGAYTSRHADIRQAGVDSLRHYVEHGLGEGRMPL